MWGIDWWISLSQNQNLSFSTMHSEALFTVITFRVGTRMTVSTNERPCMVLSPPLPTLACSFFWFSGALVFGIIHVSCGHSLSAASFRFFSFVPLRLPIPHSPNGVVSCNSLITDSLIIALCSHELKLF